MQKCLNQWDVVIPVRVVVLEVVTDLVNGDAAQLVRDHVMVPARIPVQEAVDGVVEGAVKNLVANHNLFTKAY